MLVAQITYIILYLLIILSILIPIGGEDMKDKTIDKEYNHDVEKIKNYIDWKMSFLIDGEWGIGKTFLLKESLKGRWLKRDILLFPLSWILLTPTISRYKKVDATLLKIRKSFIDKTMILGLVSAIIFESDILTDDQNPTIRFIESLFNSTLNSDNLVIMIVSILYSVIIFMKILSWFTLKYMNEPFLYKPLNLTNKKAIIIENFERSSSMELSINQIRKFSNIKISTIIETNTKKIITDDYYNSRQYIEKYTDHTVIVHNKRKKIVMSNIINGMFLESEELFIQTKNMNLRQTTNFIKRFGKKIQKMTMNYKRDNKLKVSDAKNLFVLVIEYHNFHLNSSVDVKELIEKFLNEENWRAVNYSPSTDKIDNNFTIHYESLEIDSQSLEINSGLKFAHEQINIARDLYNKL